MGDWKEYNLNEIYQFSSGLSKPADQFGFGFPFLSFKEVFQNYFLPRQLTQLVNSTENERKSGSIKRGDVFITRTSETDDDLGMTSVALKDYPDATFNGFTKRLRPNGTVEILPEFAGYYFRAKRFQAEIAGMSSVTTRASLNNGMLAALKMRLPSFPEQKAIAEVLSSLDDKIDLLHRQNETLESLAQTLFRQWFIEEANDDWKTAKLSQHTEVSRGLSYRGSGLAEVGNGLPMHNLNSIYEFGGYKHSGIKFYNGEYRDRHIIKAGDIIVANTEQGHEFRLIGSPAIVPDDFGSTGLFSQHLYKLKPLQDAYLTNEYLYYLLMTFHVREQIIGATNGSTVNMLAIEGLQEPVFKLPSEDRVFEFTGIAANYWEKKRANQYQIKSLALMRDTLLPKLMSGSARIRE